MPCDTISLSCVEFKLENTDLTLLIAAMSSLDWVQQPRTNLTTRFVRGRERASFVNGNLKLELADEEPTGVAMNEVKRAYAHEVIKATALKYGWKLKQGKVGKFVAEKAY